MEWPFTDEQIRRYSRHILLPQIGGKGQQKLLAGKVLVVGLGGLGSPASFYLAAAGVGTLGLVDSDVVDVSNLQRQILYCTGDVGRPKAECARDRLQALNPDCKAIARRESLTEENSRELVSGYDVVVDGADNFPTRYALNRACLDLGVPLCHAAIYRLDGQATTIVPGKTPCYQCIYPEPPPQGAMPTCRDAGLLGAIPGVMGIIQATEAIKLILGIGKPLLGEMVVYSGLTMDFQKVRLRRNPRCPACGDERAGGA